MDERTSFASRACAFEVPGWLSAFSVLPTRKLPMFLSRLKDTSSESENIWLV